MMTMREYPNFVAEALQKEATFIENVSLFSNDFFEQLTDIHYQDKERLVKSFRNSSNTMLYVFLKEKSGLAVFGNDIHSFQNKQTSNQILELTIGFYKKRIEEKNPEIELYLPMIFKLPAKTSKNPEKVVEEIRKKFLSGELASNIKEYIDNLKEEFKDEVSKNPNVVENIFMEAIAGKRQTLKATSSIFSIQEYCNILSEKTAFITPDNAFFNSLQTKTNEELNERLPNLKIDLKFIEEVCIKNNFNSIKNRFEFNDLDNHAWLKKGNLVLTAQSSGFYVQKKDNDNFTIYFLDKEYQDVEKEIKRIEDLILKNKINDYRDITMKVENGKVVKSDNSLILALFLSVGFTCKNMEEQKLHKREYPVDMSSYQYQRDFYYTKYNMSEFQFLNQALLTLGSGFQYSKKLKGFKSDVEYIKDLKQEENPRDKVFKNMRCCELQNFGELNPDWADGVKFMLEVLKRDRPKSIAFSGKTAEESLDKVISKLDAWIKKMDKKNACVPKSSLNF